MRYDYKCPLCRWTGEKLVKMAERDTQTCTQTVTIQSVESEETKVCGTTLVREEIALTAKMAHFWQP